MSKGCHLQLDRAPEQVRQENRCSLLHATEQFMHSHRQHSVSIENKCDVLIVKPRVNMPKVHIISDEGLGSSNRAPSGSALLVFAPSLIVNGLRYRLLNFH
jgi:hypothetical protein